MTSAGHDWSIQISEWPKSDKLHNLDFQAESLQTMPHNANDNFQLICLYSLKFYLV